MSINVTKQIKPKKERVAAGIEIDSILNFPFDLGSYIEAAQEQVEAIIEANSRKFLGFAKTPKISIPQWDLTTNISYHEDLAEEGDPSSGFVQSRTASLEGIDRDVLFQIMGQVTRFSNGAGAGAIDEVVLGTDAEHPSDDCECWEILEVNGNNGTIPVNAYVEFNASDPDDTYWIVVAFADEASMERFQTEVCLKVATSRFIGRRSIPNVGV